ncbi:YktB family protein [Brevibacillus borstelensis]|uniref:YktB family protein n=1 Tax=Brevibacillus borstelensis TaxID=45462 RepID=UPI0030BBCA74
MTISFTGFDQNDFDVFAIDGLDARMEGIKSLIRPKLELLGQHFSPSLSMATGEEMFYHVAKHARRTVNPPNDTWVAWAGDKRGYKKHPHFQAGLWGTHLFVWYAVIYESPFKEEIGLAMKEHLEEILDTVPDDFRWSPDHMQPQSTPQAVLGRDGVLQLIDRLQRVKKAEILCGINIDRHDPVLADGDKLLKRLEAAFAILTKLYNLSKLRATGLAR